MNEWLISQQSYLLQAFRHYALNQNITNYYYWLLLSPGLYYKRMLRNDISHEALKVIDDNDELENLI